MSRNELGFDTTIRAVKLDEHDMQTVFRSLSYWKSRQYPVFNVPHMWKLGKVPTNHKFTAKNCISIDVPDLGPVYATVPNHRRNFAVGMLFCLSPGRET